MTGGSLYAQEPLLRPWVDSIVPIDLGEVILISSHIRNLEHRSQPNPLSFLDQYLEDSKKVSMVKRGGYAWEPMLNDMESQRLSITIDGMRIFGACTDKMDPITSYVDVSNLSQVQVQSGQQGTRHGNTIGGSLDLRLEKSNFRPLGWEGSIESGFESNNSAYIVSGELNHSNENFYVDTDLIYRKAENYSAGGGMEVAHSQFEKFNLSANAGYKVSANDRLSASFIFDQANDVGYPALPMDVSLARAFIGSLAWTRDKGPGRFRNWESKLYANTITHIMDDSQRPDVPIRMDMPGQSDTYGLYSRMELPGEAHKILAKVDGYYNRSYAEMTMYPNDPGQGAMFMLTWPDVRTLALGLYLEDKIQWDGSSMELSTRLGLQSFHVADRFGLGSLEIFHPDMEARQQRFLKSVSARYHRDFGKLHLSGGLAYGERAPSVSEGFGFYLFNSFDNHDYIGDPDLKNEKALETVIALGLDLKDLDVTLEGNHFHTMDFIIGEVDLGLDPMTIGADGVKMYSNLRYANLYNISLEVEHEVFHALRWSARASHHRGKDHNGRNLPFISPFTYGGRLSYAHADFSMDINMFGALAQRNFSPEFGEDRSPAHTVFSVSMGKSLALGGDTVAIKAGVDNIFDRLYSTYSDWNNIPRMGRNFHISLSYAFN